MTDKNTGRNFFVMGEVVNRKDDPTQTGRCRVRWNIGALSQDQLGDDDLPWSRSLYGGGQNPSVRNTGGPHTGYQEGSKVYGFSPSGDGQDVIIMGSMPSGGKSSPDGSGANEYDSDIPHAAKSEQNGQSGGGSQSQPSFGDRNGVVTQSSIWKFGEQEGGPTKSPSKFPQLDDPIGTHGDNGGAELTYES